MGDNYFKPIKRGVEGTLTRDGVFYALTAQPGGNPLYKKLKNYVREYKMSDDYFKPVKKNVNATLTKNGDFYAVTTSPRRMPLHKRIDNYVQEECDDVELLNGTSDGIIANLDANYHKGLGPSDVRKNRRRRTHVIEKEQDNYVFEKPIKVVTNTKKGYDEVRPHDGINLEQPNSKTRRGRVQKESSGTLMCTDSWGTLTPNYRIRRLTPLECERLQAFPDNWTKYGKNDELISDTQRYKCIGNAVTTNVITAIVDEMFDKLLEDDE